MSVLFRECQGFRWGRLVVGKKVQEVGGPVEVCTVSQSRSADVDFSSSLAVTVLWRV